MDVIDRLIADRLIATQVDTEDAEMFDEDDGPGLVAVLTSGGRRVVTSMAMK